MKTHAQLRIHRLSLGMRSFGYERCTVLWLHDGFSSGTSMGAAEIVALLGDEEAIVITGSEPFDQAHGLVALVGACRAAGVSVLVFTGHQKEDLAARNCSVIQAILAGIEVLFDAHPRPPTTTCMGWSARSSRRHRFE